METDLRIEFDDKKMREYLQGLDEAGVSKILRAGVAKGAAVYKKEIAAQAPVKQYDYAGATGTFVRRGVEKEYGKPGDLKRSTKVARIRSNPAIGSVIGPMGKLAFHRWWVTQGTKPHVIRPKGGGNLRLAFGFAKLVHHPGAKANPYVARAIANVGNAGLEAAEAYILKKADELDLGGD